MDSMFVMRAASSVLLVLTMISVEPAAVSAEHHGNPGIGSFLDCSRLLVPPRCTSVDSNSIHYVYIDPSVPGRIAWALRRTMREDYGPTNLVLHEQSRITRSTDVIVTAADYGQNGAAGWVWCPTGAPQGINEQGDRWCRHQQLHFNLNPRYAVFFADRASRDYMACHELGHTIGLHHWGNPPISAGPEAATCMQADIPNGPRNLHRWDIEDINAYYPKPSATTTTAPVDTLSMRAEFSGSAGTGWLSHIGP
jgi:hypothetical protein